MAPRPSAAVTVKWRASSTAPADRLANWPSRQQVVKVRVLVANQPRLMRELVLDTIAGHEDIEIVGEVAEEKAIFEKVNELRPDCLIMTLQRTEERPSICELLWERFPRLRVLALQAESNDSVLYCAHLTVQASRIETSEKGILEALRTETVLPHGPQPALSPKVN